jgi:hypothetical protein
MATRIYRFVTTLNSGQTNDGVSDDPDYFEISVPSQNVQRTIVEIRPFGVDAFEYVGYYDTQLYHDIDSSDIQTFHRPHFVGLTLTGTHIYKAMITNKGSGNGESFGVDIVVEETAISGTAPAGGTATA